MFLTGMDIDDVARRTGISGDEVEQLYKDVELRDYMDTQIFNSDDEDEDDVFRRRRGRIMRARNQRIDPIEGPQKIGAIDPLNPNGVKKTINNALGTQKRNPSEQVMERSPFRYSSMVALDHKWRLFVREPQIIAKILDSATKGIDITEIARSVNLGTSLVRQMINDLTLSILIVNPYLNMFSICASQFVPSLRSFAFRFTNVNSAF
jgi:hypothetical protein